MKNMKLVAGGIVAVMALPAFAQDVPALGEVPQQAQASTSYNNPAPTGGMLNQTPNQQALPPVNMLSDVVVPLDKKESYGLSLAEKWKSNPDKPRRGDDGSVKYLFGATLPTMICSPLEVCNIALQPGEVVRDAHAGDTVRWSVSPATYGAGDKVTTVLVIKPKDAGLTTSLSVTTDRRIYNIKLVSTRKQWIPLMSFDYPDDVQREWDAYRAAQAKQTYYNTMPTGQNLANLDFGYRLGGDSPRWKPVRVYSDGAKTYIQFPDANYTNGAPSLVELSGGGWFSSPKKKLINYRPIGDRYVVDGVIDKAALIMGVGSDEVSVTITHEGK